MRKAKKLIRTSFNKFQAMGASPNRAAANALLSLAGLAPRGMSEEHPPFLKPPSSWMESTSQDIVMEDSEPPLLDDFGLDPVSAVDDTVAPLEDKASVRGTAGRKKRSKRMDEKAMELLAGCCKSGRTRISPLQTWRNENRKQEEELPKGKERKLPAKQRPKSLESPESGRKAKASAKAVAKAEAKSSASAKSSAKAGVKAKAKAKGSQKINSPESPAWSSPTRGTGLLGALEAGRLRSLARPLAAFADAPSLNGFKGKPSLARLAAEAAAAVGNGPKPAAKAQAAQRRGRRAVG